MYFLGSGERSGLSYLALTCLWIPYIGTALFTLVLLCIAYDVVME